MISNAGQVGSWLYNGKTLKEKLYKMILLKFLYYIVYRIFKLIPRREFIDHLLASSFFSILLITNIVTGLFLSGFIHYLKNNYNIQKLL